MVNIAYLGNFRFPWCTEVHVTRTLEQMGHTVARLQEDRTKPAEVEEAGRLVDLVLYTRTWGMPSELIDVWERLAKAGTITASFHLDLYVGLHREYQLDADPFWRTAHCFTPDGDPASQIEWDRRGINHHWSPPAVVRDECYLAEPHHRFEADVAFVGSVDYHGEWPYRRELIDWLSATYGNRFKRWGGGNTVRGPHLNVLYATTKIVVGDSLVPGFTKPWYWSDRPYETIGRGGFLIMPYIEGLDTHFTDGEHLLFYEFGDFEQLRGLIDDYLAFDDRREQIRRAGQAHVRAHHTYTHRMRDLLTTLGFEPGRIDE